MPEVLDIPSPGESSGSELGDGTQDSSCLSHAIIMLHRYSTYVGTCAGQA
jgi:hypothetical protein